MCRSWAEHAAEVVAVGQVSLPAPAHLPRPAQLLGFFPRSYAEAGPAAESQLATDQRRAALAALLQRRGVAGPEGSAFMPCAIAPLGSGTAGDATAAARVLHVLQGGLDSGLWTDLPAAGHAQRSTGSLTADTASIMSLTVSRAPACGIAQLTTKFRLRSSPISSSTVT